jgi:heat shock protein HslJ
MGGRIVMGRRWGIVVLVALAVVLVACGSAGEPAREAAGLEGTEWVLASLHGEELVASTNITLDFVAGRAGGFAGCNAYGAEYSAADGGTLAIGMMEMTAQLCPEPEGVMEQEETYTAALRSAAAYRVSGDRLEIDDGAGRTTLVFSLKRDLAMDPADLVGTQWQLASVDGSSPVEGSTITLAFAEGEISGRAGCRGYRGSYEASGDDIHFPFLAMTELDCLGPEALRRQEGAYTTSLEWATNYRLDEGRLEISTSRGEVLVYDRLPAGAGAGQEGTTWTLTTFVEGDTASSPLAGTEITLSVENGVLGEQGTMSGSAGCNTYQGAYGFDGSFLTLEAPAATEMGCLDPAGVMEQELRYLGVLGDVVAYGVDGDQLRLETGDDRALVFTAQER